MQNPALHSPTYLRDIHIVRAFHLLLDNVILTITSFGIELEFATG